MSLYQSILLLLHVPHTDGAITMTTREELVAVEGETPHTTSMPFHGSQVLVGIGIPHTDDAISTTREELVAVEGETHHISSMPSHDSQAPVSAEKETLKHAPHGAAIQRAALALLLLQQLLLDHPQDQETLP